MSTTDTSRWTPYTSEQHGFSLKHPPGWEVVPAEHDWMLEADADQVGGTGQDGFMAPSGEIWVTVWSAAAEDMPETPEGVMAWVEEYCELTDVPCPGIRDSAVQLCNERKDCHPGLLVPFAGKEFRAFFTGGNYQGRIIGAAVWRPDDHASVEPYGGARRLLEAFLSTMDVCPAQGQPPTGCPATVG
ncbi:MAG TPA: hypothetical protein VLQ67_05735 [Arachnia sp.]|nr:hypothetical protein [Arachnia sp.]